MAETEQKIQEPRQTPAGAGKKKTRILIVCLLAAAVAAAALFAVIKFAVPAGRYKAAEKLMAEGKYALDCEPYNTSGTDVTWEACSLRKWLNNEFLNAAFTAEE